MANIEADTIRRAAAVRPISDLQILRPALMLVLDHTRDAAAFVCTDTGIMLAQNELARASSATRPRNPYDKSLSDLVGELSTRSDEFRVRWAAHNVRRHTTGSKRLRHHVIGEIELNYQSFELPGEPGLRLSVFTAEPDTPNQQALRFLASWAETATPPAADAEPASDDSRQP